MPKLGTLCGVALIYLPPSEEQLRRQEAERKLWENRLQKAERLKRQKRPPQRKPVKLQDDDLPLHDTILFGLGALTLSLLFAVHSGIIQVVVEKVEQAIPE